MHAVVSARVSSSPPWNERKMTDMSIRFLAPCNSDATAKARPIKFGRTMVPLHVDLYDAAGKHVAVAQVTYMRL